MKPDEPIPLGRVEWALIAVGLMLSAALLALPPIFRSGAMDARDEQVVRNEPT